jgi:hypothetical protein
MHSSLDLPVPEFDPETKVVVDHGRPGQRTGTVVRAIEHVSPMGTYPIDTLPLLGPRHFEQGGTFRYDVLLEDGSTVCVLGTRLTDYFNRRSL